MEEIIRDILSMGSNWSKKQYKNNCLNYNGFTSSEIMELEKKHKIILPTFMRKMLTIEKTFNYEKTTFDFSNTRNIPYYITIQKKENHDFEFKVATDDWDGFVENLSNYRSYLKENFNHVELPTKEKDEFLVLVNEIDNESSEDGVKYPLLVVEKSKPNGEVYWINKTKNLIFPYAPSWIFGFWRLLFDLTFEGGEPCSLDYLQYIRLVEEDDDRIVVGFGVYYDNDGYYQIYSPFIAPYNSGEIVSYMVDCERIIIPDEEIHIRFDYPLSVDAILPFKNKGGFSRNDLFKCIQEGYIKIYREEEEAISKTDTETSTMKNDSSKGPYGIWGHVLRDLLLENLEYDKKKKLINKLGVSS